MCLQQPHVPAKRALLIALRYKNSTRCPSLKPLPEITYLDADRIKQLLIDKFDYREEDIVVMKDDGDPGNLLQPTRANIVNTGHGGQLLADTRRKTERDELDEFIVPCDHKGYPAMPVEQGMPPSGPLDRSKVHEDDTETWAKIDAVITDNVLRRELVDALPMGCTLTVSFTLLQKNNPGYAIMLVVDILISTSVFAPDLEFNYTYKFGWEDSTDDDPNDPHRQKMSSGWTLTLEGRTKFVSRTFSSPKTTRTSSAPSKKCSSAANLPPIWIPPDHRLSDGDPQVVQSPVEEVFQDNLDDGTQPGNAPTMPKGLVLCFSSNQDHEQAWVNKHQSMTSVICDILTTQKGEVTLEDLVKKAGETMHRMKEVLVSQYEENEDKRNAGEEVEPLANPYQGPKWSSNHRLRGLKSAVCF
ncbi:hypothetical protein NLI96_g1118 [Meripilus lineatus]|uniref:Uncharacterized protein n=1 Tax=Meripilus lineatus TaxID=2056292 RepID=A0AAD5VDF8_9APHY|nr:hypothetical protein NLI96_g1118 [Physisporinus lineatus]